MHEWALARGVVDAVLEVADREGMIRVRRVEVRLGVLQQVDPEVFRAALEAVRPSAEPRLDGVCFALETEDARLRCRACNLAFGLAEGMTGLPEVEQEAIHFLPELAHTFLRCPGCGSRDFAVEAGRGIRLAAVEGEVPDEESLPEEGGT